MSARVVRCVHQASTETLEPMLDLLSSIRVPKHDQEQ
jgi:hypothetical protein